MTRILDFFGFGPKVQKRRAQHNAIDKSTDDVVLLSKCIAEKARSRENPALELSKAMKKHSRHKFS